MAEQQLHAEKLNPSLLSRGETLSLLDWVKVSWFYPEEFLLQQVVSEEQRVVAQGTHETYSFPHLSDEKPLEGEISIFDKWLQAVEEIVDHRELAPNYYLGIRTIGWSEGDPKWLDEEPIADFDSELPHPDATDIAIVSRAASESSSLLGVLRSADPARARYLDRAIRRLVSFHQQQKGLTDEEELADVVDEHCDVLRAKLEDLRVSLKLQSVEQLIVEELFSDINRHGLELRKKLIQRSGKGLFVDGHGALAPSNILFELNGQELKRPEFIGRKRRGEFLRVADVMSDLARFVIEATDHISQEEVDSVINGYKTRAAEEFDEQLLRHYVIAHAIDAAHSILLSSVKDEHSKSLEIRKHLSIAFRWKLVANTPLVIVVHSVVESGFFRDLSKSVAEFIGAPRLSLTEGLGNVLNLNKVLEKNSALVVELCAANVLRKHEVAGDLSAQGLRPFFVRCEPNQEMVLTGAIQGERSSRGGADIDISLRLAPVWNENVLQPTAPEALLAREVLRGVMSRNLLG